jgi:hypothetical protein
MFPSRFQPLPAIVCCLLVPCAALTVPAFAGEKNAKGVIQRLTDDDFEVREAASRELESFPKEFAARFLNLSSAANTDQEAGERLVAAARYIFEHQIATADERWRRLYGHAGLSYERVYNEERYQPTARLRSLIGLAVSWVDERGPSAGKLKRWDVITHIDGVSVRERDIDTALLAAGEHELTLWRYRESDAIGTRDFIDPYDTDFEVLKVKLIAGWKDAEQVSQSKRADLLARLWQDYRRERESDPRGTPVALD